MVSNWVLRSDRRAYVLFIKDLYDRGMLRTTLHPQDFTFPFFPPEPPLVGSGKGAEEQGLDNIGLGWEM